MAGETGNRPPGGGDSFRFTVSATDGRARAGRIDTPRGAIHTPAFMPVGTAASVKAMYPDQVRNAGADIILGNTYHLMLRPGAERIARLGGLHEFAQWPHPILTDSGGFQVMSLAKLRTLSEDGVTFRSHIDGSTHMLSPERSMAIQGLLGSDIQMVLDECTPFPCAEPQAATSMRLSLRWAERSRKAFAGGPGQALFGIVQGGIYEKLRAECASELQDIGFEGYGVGGLAVGEGQEQMLRTLEATCPLLPHGKPRYLMGVGTPDDLLAAVERGIDMFDCVMPTRSGRHGQAFTRFGRLNLRNAAFRDDPRPLDEQSACPAAWRYSRAYLHHLIRCNEYLGAMLLSWANLHYYLTLMSEIRAAIAEKRFSDFQIETRLNWLRARNESPQV